MLRKGLAVAVILLFIGMSVVPSTAVQELKDVSTVSFDGNTLYVGGSGPNNYTKIQDAIDDAVDGDTVFVYDDSSPYYGNLKIDKSINLIGENKDTTIIDGNKTGIVVRIQTDLVKVSGLTIKSSNIEFGLAIRIDSNNNTISNNIIIGNNFGIHLMESSSNSIKDNYFMNDGVGIHFKDDCFKNSIFNNTFSNGGLFFDDCYDNFVCNNTLNGKPIIYYEDHSDMVIIDNDVGQIILIDCDNITIKNQELTSSAEAGIQLLRSNRCDISYNSIINSFYGISFRNSNDNIVKNNDLNQNEYGLYLLGSARNNISFNSFTDNFYGCGIDRSHNNSIFRNICEGSQWVGFILWSSSHNKIMKNTIKNCLWGIHLDSSDYNNITMNLISTSILKGILLWNCNGNNIFFNTFKFTGSIIRRSAYFYIDRTNLKYCINYWYGNYWNRPRFLPKLILGQSFLGWTFWYPLPVFRFDWRPAREPYDIGV